MDHTRHRSGAANWAWAAVAVLVAALAACGTTSAEPADPDVTASLDGSSTTHTEPSTTTAAPSTTSTAPALTAPDPQQLADAAYPGGVSTVLVGVFRPDETAVGVAGVDGDGVHVTADTPWEGASLAMMIIATTVMQLAEEGLVDLDAPAADYVDFDVTPDITVRNVLNHATTIRSLTYQFEFCPSDLSLDLMKDTVRSTGGEGEPGTYSNTNYLLLGEVIRQITGQDVGEVTRTNIFEPLGMDTTYWWETQTGPAPYWPRPTSDPGTVSPFTCPKIDRTVGTEGFTFITSLADMERFLRGLFKGDLVSPDSLQAMLPPPGQEAGLGLWAVSITSTGQLEPGNQSGLPTLYGHLGARGDFETVAYYDPTDNTAYVVYATEGTGIEDILVKAWDWNQTG